MSQSGSSKNGRKCRNGAVHEAEQGWLDFLQNKLRFVQRLVLRIFEVGVKFGRHDVLLSLTDICGGDFPKMTSTYSRVPGTGKRFFCLFSAFMWLGAACPASAQSPHKIIIPRVSQSALGHLGVHTHANFLLFNTGILDIPAMQRDPSQFPRLALRAHSSLPTDRAALPPDLAAFGSPSDPPLPNPYGPIDGGYGKPGWTLLPMHRGSKNLVKVLVPTRFADWLAAQPLARRRLYSQPQRFTLQITWG